MVLTIKQKALLITASMIAGVFLLASAFIFILQNVPAETIGNVCLLGFVSWIVWLFYQITLNRLEYQETAKKLNESFKKNG